MRWRARCAVPAFTPRFAPVALGRWWQRACEPTFWQATVAVRPMRQHSCHRAAAWSAASTCSITIIRELQSIFFGSLTRCTHVFPLQPRLIVGSWDTCSIAHSRTNARLMQPRGTPRERPTRRLLPPPSAPAADHAAALWQLCCRIGRTTTVACQRVGSYARGHHLPRATGARRGVNNGAAQRAGDGSRVYPAIRHRLWIRTRSSVRRLTIQRRIGAAFGGRDADGHPQGSICRVWAHPVRRSASRGARERNTSPKHRTRAAPPREHHRGFRSQFPSSGTLPDAGGGTRNIMYVALKQTLVDGEFKQASSMQWQSAIRRIPLTS